MSEATIDAESGLEKHVMARVLPVLLVAGVGLSALLLVAGLALLVITGRTGYGQALTPGLLLIRDGGANFPRCIGDTWAGALALRPFALIELGALVLVATPIFRVATSAVLFAVEEDRLYAGLTLAVLLLLVVSLLWIK